MEIINFEKVDKKSVRGYVDLKIQMLKPATIILRRLAYINNGNKKYFTMPSFSRNFQTEKPKYEKYFEFENPSFNVHTIDVLVNKFKEYCEIHEIEPDANIKSFAQEKFDNEVIPF